MPFYSLFLQRPRNIQVHVSIRFIFEIEKQNSPLYSPLSKRNKVFFLKSTQDSFIRIRNLCLISQKVLTWKIKISKSTKPKKKKIFAIIFQYFYQNLVLQSPREIEVKYSLRFITFIFRCTHDGSQTTWKKNFPTVGRERTVVINHKICGDTCSCNKQ